VLYLPAILETNVNLLRPLAEEKGLVLRLWVHYSARAWMRGDPTRISQIVNNLVNNAIKFTSRGSVEVTAARYETEVVTIMIADTGEGISAAHRSKLFAPFQQLDARRKRRHGGVGLGLTITKNLVEAMGGDIDIESRRHAYTRVRVRLPLPGTQAPEAPWRTAGGPDPVSSQGAFCGKGLHVLVVDDNRINRQYLSKALQQMGVSVTEAASGKDALTACARVACDIILMDVHMADMDGVEATAQIRASGIAHTPVIGVSADVIGGGADFIRAGMDGFLAKPIAEASLLALLVSFFPGRARFVESISMAAGGGDPSTVIDAAQGLRLACGDERLWLGSLDTLCTALPEQVATLRAALRHGDLIRISESAHQIAGAAAYVGAVTLQRAAAALERSSQGAPRHLAMCVRAVIDAATEFERYLAGRPPTTSHQE